VLINLKVRSKTKYKIKCLKPINVLKVEGGAAGRMKGGIAIK
jgi:hypothetical protein